MSKTKTPFHSFKAHGTIAGSVTYQDRNRATMVRRKPTPTDRKSLPQIYHRWLYQDGVALWHTLSNVDKLQWELLARPFRITAFNYFMRTYLTTLPDLAAGYHLDCLSPTTAIDFSKNANNGVIYGALPAKGIIHNALLFDGVDDCVVIPSTPSLNIREFLTIETWVYFTKLSLLNQHFISKPDQYYIRQWPTFLTFLLRITSPFTFQDLTTLAWTPPLNMWVHLTCTYNYLTHLMSIYINGSLNNTKTVTGFTDYRINTSNYPFLLSSWAGHLQGRLDEVRLYNRTLSAEDIKRHSERRYPL